MVRYIAILSNNGNFPLFWKSYNSGIQFPESATTTATTWKIPQILAYAVDVLLVKAEIVPSITDTNSHLTILHKDLEKVYNNENFTNAPHISGKKKWISNNISNVQLSTTNKVYSGHLFNFLTYQVYGFLSHTNVRFIIICTEEESNDISKIFHQLYRIYISGLSNPFSDWLETDFGDDLQSVSEPGIESSDSDSDASKQVSKSKKKSKKNQTALLDELMQPQFFSPKKSLLSSHIAFAKMPREVVLGSPRVLKSIQTMVDYFTSESN